MVALLPVANQLGISMIGGGHCHAQVAEVLDGVALVEGGSFLDSYCRVALRVDDSGEVTGVTATLHANDGGIEDPVVAAIVQRWSDAADQALGMPIGYAAREIPRDERLFRMVLNAWLDAYPADVAISNLGGFRQPIPAGQITIGTIVGVLPFDNHLVEVELTGAQLLETLAWGSPAVTGIEPYSIEPETVYSVLVNDYLYSGGDGYFLHLYDPDAYHTGIGWRQPVIDWLISLGTSPQKPLEEYLP
jgi:2',3'-cyclic-nucleotide 2'-phosphodiesterase (5'-nucleotidase family)